MSFNVYDKPCKNCLFSKDAIVGPARVKELIKECVDKGTFFTCHVSSMSSDNDNICCRRFYDQIGEKSNIIRIAKRLGIVEEVPLPETNKLNSYADFEKSLRDEHNRRRIEQDKDFDRLTNK